ncbi:hypothetical protein [Lysinibacillus sp. G4S2]|uniref:hypothetical protein n=1 Tax=Lysinibacillus sp. G4S2 TaxID=3055859 RepID=UPI0025A01FFF|nr:hypothetical protein [Lysinibacillus sp. G4S2]MDM5249105.1 hypothetical protein [Lysinibacillus sp. G4S2]
MNKKINNDGYGGFIVSKNFLNDQYSTIELENYVMDIDCYAWIVDVKYPPGYLQLGLIGNTVFIADESAAIEDRGYL